ncbi:hypothetical protein AVEN_142281-1 [Araneus ventricosus]|uniref:Uncharacterized protein n=1 Tax=Araneus ventricosus TaxID=182803 RepID=A0A4Y2MZ63_ARAVE|nr:hypothetical protein AVEN_142281-1 [Araneus ventricosus]
MKPRPEDGSLEKITSCGLNSEFNAIIIQRTDEFKEPDGATYAFATLDRTREGVEWPGDQILEKLIPELPKVKIPEVNKPDVMTKTNSLHRHRIERKFYQSPVQKNDYFTTTRRPKPPQKRFRSNRSENPSSFNDIDPWVCKPWDNQAFFSGMNTAASVSATSLISTAPFNSFYVPTSASSLPFPPRTSSNIFNVPNSSTYEKNIRPTAAPNISFINNNLGHLNRPPPPNRMPIGPRPSFPLPNRFPQHPDRGFCGPVPVPNVDFNGPSRNTGLLGETPATRYQVKQGLLGDSPFPNMPFNRNLVMFPNNISTQSNPEGNTAILLTRDEENIGDKNSFTKNSSIVGSYDTGYGRIPRSNFDQYKDGNEISGQVSHDSYKYPSNPDDSRNNSFRDTSEKFSRYHNSGSSVNHCKDQYKDSYNHLDHNRPKDNNKNIISLKSSRDSHKTNYGRFEKPSAGVSHSKSGYKEVGDNPCETSYEGSQTSSISKTSPFMNRRNRNPKKDSLIHISNSAVVYNPEDFQNDSYPAAATNSSTSRSNLNSVSRSNRRNIHSKNTRGTEKQGTTNKFTNNDYYNLNRVKSNQLDIHDNTALFHLDQQPVCFPPIQVDRFRRDIYGCSNAHYQLLRSLPLLLLPDRLSLPSQGISLFGLP